MAGFQRNGVDEVLTRLGNPTDDTITNIDDKIGDIARSLDLILGNKWDATGDLSSDIISILAALGAGSTISGTSDSGTAGTLVDAALTQGDDYFNGMVLFMNSGNNIGLSRTIVDFDAASDTIYVEPDFPNAIGTDDYTVLDQSAWAHVLIGNNNADNEADTSAVVANADGSVLEREEYIQTSIGADLVGGVADVKTVVDNIEDYVDGTNATPAAYRTEANVRQLDSAEITCAANAAQTTLLTVSAFKYIVVEKVIVYANSAQTADLTEFNVKCGDVGNEVSLLNRVMQSDVDATSKQSSYDGAVVLKNGDLITIDPTGTGATALDMILVVIFYGTTDGDGFV